MKRALITGIAGQDGSFLAELLLAKGYEVHGLIRRSSSIATRRIDGIYQDPHEDGRRLRLHYGDLTDSVSLVRLVERCEPDEIYNLAAQSHVAVSFELPEFTADVTGLGALRVLEAMRVVGSAARFYQASSSEMFGASPPPQDELTAFHPRSPYGIAKLFAHWTTVNHREAYGVFACSGILFNHESERRGETFVTRKVTRAVAAIEAGLQQHVYLGNLEARRDWGFAGDYVDAMWRMLQQDEPGDYVVATGETHTVKELCEIAFAEADLDWRAHVRIDPTYERPAEVDYLLGDPSKAQKALGWAPTTDFVGLIQRMVAADRLVVSSGLR